MILRESRVLRKLRAGHRVCSIKLSATDPKVAEIAAACAPDCLWLCMEHVPIGIESIANLVRAAKLHDVDTVVRTRRGSYSDLIMPLEADAAGIMVPHVKSAAEAREVAQMTRFQPIGRRAIDGGSADGGFCRVPLDEYARHANAHRFVMVQIEDPEALDELDTIATTPGIDILFFGPGDYSHGLGLPGKLDDPRLVEARRAVARAAVRHGKWAGTTANIQTMPQLFDEGYHVLNLSSDVHALSSQFDSVVKAFANATGGH